MTGKVTPEVKVETPRVESPKATTKTATRIAEPLPEREPKAPKEGPKILVKVASGFGFMVNPNTGQKILPEPTQVATDSWVRKCLKHGKLVKA